MRGVLTSELVWSELGQGAGSPALLAPGQLQLWLMADSLPSHKFGGRGWTHSTGLMRPHCGRPSPFLRHTLALTQVLLQLLDFAGLPGLAHHTSDFALWFWSHVFSVPWNLARTLPPRLLWPVPLSV